MLMIAAKKSSLLAPDGLVTSRIDYFGKTGLALHVPSLVPMVYACCPSLHCNGSLLMSSNKASPLMECLPAYETLQTDLPKALQRCLFLFSGLAHQWWV